jgi:hypothetical protein
MRRSGGVLFVAAGIVAAIIALVVPAGGASSSNLLINSSFETGTLDWPDSWSRNAWGSLEDLSWDDSRAHEGDQCAKISAAAPNDAFWSQNVSVEPNTNYLVSGWIKTKSVGHTQELVDTGACLCVYGTWDQRSAGLFGTNDWTYASFVFNSGQNAEVTIAARLGYWAGTTTGTAWFDDIQLTPLDPNGPHPSWKILVLIYGRLDFTCTDNQGVQHHYVANASRDELENTAASAQRIIETEIPILDSGNMIPTLEIRYPRRILTQLSPWSDGWFLAYEDAEPELAPAFDSVIAFWPAWAVDQTTGLPAYLMDGAAGLSLPRGTSQTYSSIPLNSSGLWFTPSEWALKHEWGHAILWYYDAAGTAPKPAVDNHRSADYVHWPTGEPYPEDADALESGFTHDYYSGTIATSDQSTRRLGITPEAWATGGPVSKPARPSLTPAQRLQAQRARIDELIAAGALKKGYGQALQAKLNAAAKALNRDQYPASIKHLQSYLDQLRAFVQRRFLAKADGQVLIAEARAIIAQLRELEASLKVVAAADEEEPVRDDLAAGFVLSPNYPNPFNAATTIAFSLPQTCQVQLAIFNILGEEVATLVSAVLPAGRYERQWSATGMASGIYLYRLQAGDFAATRRLLLVK